MKKRISALCLILGLFLIISVDASYDFCDEGEEGSLNIDSIVDLLKDNDEAWEWTPEDDVELQVNVSSLDEDDKYIIELIFVDGDDDIDIAEDDDDLISNELSGSTNYSVEFSFKVDEDVDADDYDLYVKVYLVGDEDEECSEDDKEIEILKKDVELEFCDNNSVDSSDLEITTMKDELEENEDRWKWETGQEIEVSVKLSNKDYSERDFRVELKLYDEEGEEVDFSDEDLEEIEEIAQGEEETFSFNFVLGDLDEGDYYLYAVAYDDDDEDICTYYEEDGQKVTISESSSGTKILIEQVTGPNKVEEGSSGTYSVIVKNLGSTQSKVLIRAYNTLLNLRAEQVISNLASGDSQVVSFNISFSDGASAFGTVKLVFSSEYDYDSTKNYYAKVSDSSMDKSYLVNITQKTIVKTEAPKSANVSTVDISKSLSATNNSAKSSKVSTLNVVLYSIIGLVLLIVLFLIYKIFSNKRMNQGYVNFH